MDPLETFFPAAAELVNTEIDRLIPDKGEAPQKLRDAMRWSLFAGGKRFRPALLFATGRAFGAADAELLRTAAAVEMIHTYSLIHDDLPALDNDALRRGMPTCHVVFGEAVAILAGDALQTYAYEVLSRLGCPADQRVKIIYEIAHATGTVDGMIGGQVKDVEAERTPVDAKTLEYIHRSKTGALITASLVTGGIYAGADEGDAERLRAFGRSAGLAFQIADDVLDVTQSSEQLGKTAGKDQSAAKATYPALFGVVESMRMAQELVEEACAELDTFGEPADTLKGLARFLVERKS
jgi:geranylgeranyl diphosphate synthase type II